LSSVAFFVNANNEHGSVVLGRSGDDDTLGTSLNVLLARFLVQKDTSALNDIIYFEFTPWEFRWILLSEYVSLKSVDHE